MSFEIRPASIESRIAKVERENRSWKIASAVAGGVLVVWLSLATAIAFLGATKGTARNPDSVAATYGSFGTLKAKRLEIANDSGDVVLVASQEGDVVKLHMRNGEAEAIVSVSPTGAAVVAQTPRDLSLVSTRGFYLATPEQVPRDGTVEGGKGIAFAAVKNDLGGGSVEIYNPLGEAVVRALSGRNNDGAVIVTDFRGEPVEVMGLKK
jgi:hypothetical protein